MIDVSTTMAKLSGIRKALSSVAGEAVGRQRGIGDVRTRSSFPQDLVQHYFSQAAAQLEKLRELIPRLYSDFQSIRTIPEVEMVSADPNITEIRHFSRTQVEQLVRDIDQIFEIRANSELSQPAASAPNRVFISHGSSQDWRVVQSFIEKDVGVITLELAQEPNMGRTIIEKLIANTAKCDSAVIVMTGDDATSDQARVRENVMHEIGFFQGAFGRTLVVLLHEDGVNIPTNLSGVAYIPFPKGRIEAGFHVLQRELKAIYKC